MAVKIRVSYERPEELQEILRLLQPKVSRWTVSKNREGKFMKAYIKMR